MSGAEPTCLRVRPDCRYKTLVRMLTEGPDRRAPFQVCDGGTASVRSCQPKVGFQAISADLRWPQLGPVWGHEEPFKMRRRTATAREHRRGPARGACRGARVVLRLEEPNLRPGGLPQPWPRPAVSPPSLPPMWLAIRGLWGWTRKERTNASRRIWRSWS